MNPRSMRHLQSGRPTTVSRRGAFLFVAIASLAVLMCFTALCVDIGMVAVEKTKLQNSVDAAAMAAVMEINAAIEEAGPEVEDVTTFAINAARQKAAEVAQFNGTHVDPSADVEFGRRTYNADTESYEITWGVTPANTVRVNAIRDNDDLSAPDGKVPVSFAQVWGSDPSSLFATATAYVDARDIVAVIDFSGSMSHTSLFKWHTLDELGQPTIEDNLEEIFYSLELADTGDMEFTPEYLVVYSPPPEDPSDPIADVTFRYDEVDVVSDQPYDQIKLDFTDGTTQSIDVVAMSGTYSGTGEHAGKDIATAWVVYTQAEDIVVEGEEGQGCRPTITVTFNGDGTSVFIESSKDLSNVVLEFADESHYKFDNLNQGPTGTFQGIGEHAGKLITGVWVKSGCNQSGDGPGYGERFDSPTSGQTSIAIEFKDTNDNVLAFLGLDAIPYPYPSGSWSEFVAYARNDADLNNVGYREMYGGLTFAHYLLEIQPRAYQTPDLWKTPHYPFHAVKQGVMELADYLNALSFGDHLGLVSYDTEHRREDFVVTDQGTIDISAAPITGDYSSIKTIMEHKQAAEYFSSTNIAGGILEARLMLQAHGRSNARPTILLMTDGVPTMAETYSIPANWDWDTLFDYDNDGVANYELYGNEGGYQAKMSTLVHAKLAVDAGATIHTLTVGNSADEALMQAIAWLGRGKSTNVPSGLTAEELQEEVIAAFQRLTAVVPPPKLVSN